LKQQRIVSRNNNGPSIAENIERNKYGEQTGLPSTRMTAGENRQQVCCLQRILIVVVTTDPWSLLFTTDPLSFSPASVVPPDVLCH
jgi:hypothetical protein